MHKYIIKGSTSQDFASAMLSKPQNRRDSVEPFIKSLRMEIIEFLFTSGEGNNFFSIVLAESDDQLEALRNIVYASGNFSNMSWSRAFEAEEYQKIFEIGHEKMANYISASQAAGKE